MGSNPNHDTELAPERFEFMEKPKEFIAQNIFLILPEKTNDQRQQGVDDLDLTSSVIQDMLNA